MGLIESFNPPANLDEMSDAGRSGWSKRVTELIDTPELIALPQFFNPLDEDGDPAALSQHPVAWTAFPATLRNPGGSDPKRWAEADSSRENQDEYCEWGVERSGDEISRVTFTTETPDYFEQMLKTDKELLRDLYEKFTGKRPELEDLLDDNGKFNVRNDFNRDPDGRIAHLSQGSNNLFAAIALVAQATVLREKDGAQVTDQASLIKCGNLGEARRNSDPQIAGAVNRLVDSGRDVSLADPAGLYIDEFISAGISAPDDADASEFWKVTRGDGRHALRATFEVPAERGYSVSKVKIDGHPIETGAQLADRVRVRVVALSRASADKPVPQPCVSE